jgi:hypothetical protein
VKILALDLATSVGYACGDGRLPPVFGSHRLPHTAGRKKEPAAEPQKQAAE